MSIKDIFPLIIVYLFFVFGLPFISWGVLQIQAFVKHPSNKEIDKFLKSLRPPISTIFVGSSKRHLFFLQDFSMGSLYDDLVRLKEITGIFLWLHLAFPFLLGGIFIIVPLFLFTNVFLGGEGFDRILGFIFLLLSILSLLKATRLGTNL